MPSTVEILRATNPADAERWSALVRKSPARDVYYLPAYVRASSEMEQSEPIAVVTGSGDSRILAPLLIRSISVAADESRIEWLDACSPYGYGGLLNLSTTGKVDKRDLDRFIEGLQDWCCERGLVCCALRLHPLMSQEEWFKPGQDWQDFVRIVYRGSTSAIDLKDWDASLDQPKGLRRDRCADMRSARRNLRVTWNNGEDHDAEANLNLFARLYTQTLDRLNAKVFYRFSPSYFSGLAALGQHLGIALAWHGDEPVGGNLFLFGSNYGHGHLAGSNQTGRKYGAGTFLLVEGAKQARQRGCELLHIGGGMRSGDSLEDYKRSFGGPSYRYSYVTCVADPERFEQLCRIPNAPWPYITRTPLVHTFPPLAHTFPSTPVSARAGSAFPAPEPTRKIPTHHTPAGFPSTSDPDER
jgi:Acetyltransferase (GNAT) domain